VTIQEQLLEKGVIVRPRAHYDLPHWLRFTGGTSDQNITLIWTLGNVPRNTNLA